MKVLIYLEILPWPFSIFACPYWENSIELFFHVCDASLQFIS